MIGQGSELVIKLRPDPYTGDLTLTRLTSELRDVLLELDVDAVERVVAPQVSAVAKGYHLETGVLMVRFALGPDLLQSVVSSVRRWADRRQRLCSAVELTLDGDSLEITGPHSAAQERVVDLWIARHTSLE